MSFRYPLNAEALRYYVAYNMPRRERHVKYFTRLYRAYSRHTGQEYAAAKLMHHKLSAIVERLRNIGIKVAMLGDSLEVICSKKQSEEVDRIIAEIS